MPNTTPLTDAINALTTYANETTGASDTTLSDAVETLVDGYGGGGGSDTVKWKASRASFPSFGGIYDGTNLELDFNNMVSNIPSINYMAMSGGPNGTLTFKNLSPSLTGSQMGMGDFLRQAPCFKVINLGGIAPQNTTRWFGQWRNSQDGQVPTGTITVTNLCLDNLSGNNDSFSGGYSDLYNTFDVYFTGELKNTINLSSWRMLNADSVNRLIDCLYDYSSGDEHTLTLGANILPLVDSSHTAIATARNWALA